MIRLLLVDDRIIIRQGLKSLLESQSNFQVVAEADSGQTAGDSMATEAQNSLQQLALKLYDCGGGVLVSDRAPCTVSQASRQGLSGNTVIERRSLRGCQRTRNPSAHLG